MPLHGKIVVIKRSGGDGTEFPLTATCLFGRKPDCDIRIQLPQVSKEHCRIDFNENKEVILTNLSSVNPTRVNGEVLQQSERLKHGDVITIIDRSFRFEYPPAPTPKKRSSIGGKTETFKVLQDQQVGDTVTAETGEKKISEVSTDPHLKDGTNYDNIQRSLEKTVEVVSKEDDSLLQNKTTSPFNDLYQMIKKSLDVKTPRKSSASLLQTPTSRFCTPKPVSVRKNGGDPVIPSGDNSTPKKDDAKVSSGADTKGDAENICDGTPKSVRKLRKSFQVASAEMARPEPESAVKSEATSSQKRNCATPQKFTVCEVIEQVCTQTPKSPMRRRSKEATPAKPTVTKDQEKQATMSPKTKPLEKASPRNSGKAEKVKRMSQKRKSGELGADLPTAQIKKKRVSFGGHLSPELFDKRLPPDSPLRKGAAPRRSLCLFKPKQSLLRRASVIGLLQEFEQEHPGSPNVQSPAKLKTPSPGKKSPKSRSPSPKAATPAKKSPKSKTPSPKAATPAKKSPKSKTPSPKAATPAKKSPKSKTPSPKAATPAKKSPKSKTPSPKAATPAKKSPKSKTPSPKAATPAKKSPKSRSPSPKAASPAKKSPKSKTPAPKAATPGKKSPNSRTPSPKTATPGKKSPKSRSPSPRAPSNKVETPGVQTPTVRGRFSVSHIGTPSPIAEATVTDQMHLATVTPKVPLRRKSMKSTSRKTPSVAKSAVKLMRRRSGISRASMKVLNSWADIVKFGKTKTEVAAPAKITVTKKTMKKAVSKPQTPARKLKGHVSTGHADSPLTIVVGRAHKQKVVHPTGAAPRLVTNIAVLKKNMKMDEDLTGISEMYKTPVNTKKRRSVVSENSAMKTPVGGLGTSVVEPSVLNTPEEPGEMMVSPLSVSSTVKDRKYNSEAVQRLLHGDEESSFVTDIPASETPSDDSGEQQCTDVKTASVTTPSQKPELPECLTGVKRIMKTPRQKAEPVEDLRGRLLKTPKQKLEQQECLTGVKRIFSTPQQEAEPLEDLQEKLLETPKAPEAGDVSSSGVEEIVETPANRKESEDLSETPNVKSSPLLCLTGIKRIMKTPKEKIAPVEDMVGVKRLVKTPREKVEPVEENFGIKRLMKSPRLRGNAPVEDFEGLQELMEEPLTDPTRQLETDEVEGQIPLVCGVHIAKELDFAHEEPRDDVPSDVTENVPQVDMEKEEEANVVVIDDQDVPSGQDSDESSRAMETLSQLEEPKVDPAHENASEEQPNVDTVDENGSEEQPEVKTAACKVSEMDTAATDPDHKKKSVRGRRAKTAESKSAEEKQEAAEHSEDPVVPAPVRGRRGGKTEAAAPAVKQTTRSRNTKTAESRDVELTMEKSASLPSKAAPRPKRGRNAKNVSDDPAEMVQEVSTEAEMVAEPESEQRPPIDANHEANDSTAPLEKAVLKPRRGRKMKQPEQSDVPCTHSDEVPQADMAKEADSNEVCGDQLEVVPSGNDENKSSDTMETVPQAPAPESVPEVETATCEVTEVKAAVVEKKPVRGRRVKTVESKSAEDKQEVTERPEDPIVSAPIRGRRGKKTEAPATPTVRQTTRGRNVKLQGSTSDQPEMEPEKAVETKLAPEITAEAVSDQIPPAHTHQEEADSAPPAEEAAVKPTRGRKTKQTPVEPLQPEPEKNEVVSDENLTADAQKSIPAVEKPRRGRRMKPDTVEQKEVTDTVVSVETTQQSQPPVRAKRGRNIKQEDEKTTKSQEPVKKIRRTRKAEQDHVEPREEVPEEAEAPLVAEPVKVTEQAAVAAKPRRGGRKAKQDAEIETPIESTEVQEVPAVSSTDKPKRGRRGKQVPEEVEVTAVAPEAEEKNNVEPDAQVIKPSRARGVKNEVSQAVPAKRARRGAALPPEETKPESAVLVSESASASVEPPKRGRRAAAKPAADDSTVTSDETNVVEETKMSKKSVQWKANLEVCETAKVTPVKTVRSRKSKPGDKVDTETKNLSNGANKTEEKDLSGKAVEAPPVKRARRGAKAAEVTADGEESASTATSVEAETQPKTRRGRSAKK
ncbi:proliferation marker protein Ki-67 [Chaetodon trifascialis]|uniref:proliferation marker protein Ki-67 n=1 Tax=Chaetodon trifascialis TaxID=109706 RepID=UPI0039958FEB